MVRERDDRCEIVRDLDDCVGAYVSPAGCPDRSARSRIGAPTHPDHRRIHAADLVPVTHALPRARVARRRLGVDARLVLRLGFDAALPAARIAASAHVASSPGSSRTSIGTRQYDIETGRATTGRNGSLPAATYAARLLSSTLKKSSSAATIPKKASAE